MKAECMSLVCRMVNVFFPSAAAKTGPGEGRHAECRASHSA